MEVEAAMLGEQGLEQLRQWDKEGLFQLNFNNKEGTDEYQYLYADLLVLGVGSKIDAFKQYQIQLDGRGVSQDGSMVGVHQFVEDVAHTNRAARYPALGDMRNRLKLLKEQPVATSICAAALQTHISRCINPACKGQ